MGVVYHRYKKAPMLSSRNAMNALALAFFAFAAQVLTLNAQPVLSLPVLISNGTQAQMTVSNCYNTYAQYLLQVSTNLTDWSTLATNDSFGANCFIQVPANGPACFYRAQVVSVPLPNSISQLGILCKSNMDIKGNNVTFDSFDSSDPSFSTAGQWIVSKRKANANIGTLAGITNSLNVGNGNIFGVAYTGPGLESNGVFIGAHGSVGDLTWVGEGISGIQPGHWRGNLNLSVPDVAAPNTSGWFTSLPAPDGNGVVNLAGGNYVVASLASPLLISSNTTLWVQGSLSLGGVTITNNAQFVLYVGNMSNSSNSLSWSGLSTINTPGFASNFQIYGLPSLTAINLLGNGPWTGTVYAPEATLVAGGGGASLQNASGQIVVNNISVSGQWNFHFDEHLATLNLHP